MPVLSGLVPGIIAIVAGIVILIWPHIISYIIAIYLLIIGIIAIISAVT